MIKIIIKTIKSEIIKRESAIVSSFFSRCSSDDRMEINEKTHENVRNIAAIEVSS
jgi:hypothetical protein